MSEDRPEHLGHGFLGLAAAVAAAVELQCSLLAGARDALAADEALRAKSVSVSQAAAAVWGAARWWDGLALGVLLGLISYAAVAEVRSRAVRRWIEAALAHERTERALLALLSLLAVRWMLDPAPFLRHDGLAHTGLTALVAENLRGGEGPWWSFRWYGGFPLLRDYGCGFHVPAALASLVAGSAEFGVRAVLIGSALATPFAVASCARALGCGRAASLVAGVAVVLSFQFTHTIAWSGKFPDAVLYLLFPLAVREAVRTGARPVASGGARLGLWCGAMGIVHPGLGPLGAAIAALTGLTAVWSRGGGPALRRAAAATAIAAVVAGAMTMPPLLSMRDDRSWLLLGRGGLQTAGLLRPGLPGTDALGALLRWRMGWTSDVFAYLGLTLAVGGIGGAAIALRRADRSAVAVIAGIAAAVLCIGGGYLLSRAVAFLVVLLALGLALGIECAVRRGASAGGVALVAVSLLAADLGPTTLQAPGLPGGAAGAAHLERLREESGGGRSVRLVRRGDDLGFHTTDNALDARLDVPLGSLVYMGASPWTPFTLSIANEASSRLRTAPRVDGWTLRALALQGVSVVSEDARTGFGPLDASRLAPDAREALAAPAPGAAGARLRVASPVTFGDTVAVAPRGLLEEIDGAPFTVYEAERELPDTRMRAAVRGLIDAMGLDAAEPRAARLLARDAKACAALLAAGAGACRGTAGDVRSGPREWAFDVDVREGGPARLAIAWSPHLRVRVDGRDPPAGPFPDATGAVLVTLPQGARTVSVTSEGGRPAGAWLVAATVAAVALVVALRKPRPAAA